MHTLPINYAGLALIIFAIILFLLEIKITSYGMLSIGGVIALFLGSMMLIRKTPGIEVVNISWSVIIGVTVITALFFIFIIGFAVKAQRTKPVTGKEGMIGVIGEVTQSANNMITVRVHGELWKAESTTSPLATGQKIKVVAVRDLKLYVEPI
jgi:membrane-bound serine protease (ClpP class)